MLLRLFQISAVIVGLTTNSAAQILDRSPTPVCTETWKAVKFYDRLDAMPSEVVEAFATLLDEKKNSRKLTSWIAERNRPWRSTDGVMPSERDLPNLRFIYGLKSRDRWFVWYEYGGIVRGAKVVAFDAEPSTSRVTFIARLYAEPADLCVVTSALMHARIAPGGGLDNR